MSDQISRRDYFAAHAMRMFVADGYTHWTLQGKKVTSMEQIATMSILMADEMLQQLDAESETTEKV